MTTPNQGIPPGLQTLLGVGAFQIGGGGTNFGQAINETFVRNLIAGIGSGIWTGVENVAGIIDNIAQWLATLPLEALKMFEYFIPGSIPDQFEDIATAVATIVEALSIQKLLMSLDDFDAWLVATYNILQTEVHQILDAIGGLVVTPITTRVAGFVDWLASLAGFQTDTESVLSTIGGQIDDLIWGVGGTVIGDVVEVIGIGAQAGIDIAQILTEASVSTIAELVGLIIDGVTALARMTALITGVGATDITEVVDIISDAGTDAAAAITRLGTILSNAGVASEAVLGQLIADLATMLSQISDIFNGGVVDPINTVVEQINDWWTTVGAGIPTVASNATAALADAADALSQLGDAIANAGAANAAALGTVIQDAATNSLGLVSAVNNAAAGLISGGSDLLADAADNIAALFGGAPAFLQGLSGVFGQQATNDAYAAAAAQAAAQAAEQARINSAFNAVFNVSPASAGNVNQTIDFTVIPNQNSMSGIMLPATGSGSGYMGVTSGEAKWQGGSGTDTEVFPTQTVSDYQVITATLGSLNNVNTAGILGNWNLIVGRCNSARTIYVAVRIGSAWNGSAYAPSIALGYSSGGGFTALTTNFSPPSLATGGVVKLILGDPSSASPYAMQVLYNGTPVITYTDSSHLSQLGASYRYVGLQQTGTASGSAQTPAAIRTVTYQDNPPPPSAYPFSGRPTADVDAKGRQYASSDCGRIDRDNGGAWENIYLGPKAFATEPPSSGWSTTTLGSATFAADLDGRKLSIPSASGDNWRVEYRTPAATSNYICTAYLEFEYAVAQFMRGGLVLRESSTGRLITFGMHYDSTDFWYIAVYKWTNPTTFSASYTTAKAIALGGIPNWLRIRDDGSNRYFEYSFNGVGWMTLYSVGRTDFMTPNQIGWGASNNGSGVTNAMRLRSLSGI